MEIVRICLKFLFNINSFFVNNITKILSCPKNFSGFLPETKSYVFSTFKDWKTMSEKQRGRQVKCCCIDNGLEFCSDEFNTLCKKEGIVRH